MSNIFWEWNKSKKEEFNHNREAFDHFLKLWGVKAFEFQTKSVFFYHFLGINLTKNGTRIESRKK